VDWKEAYDKCIKRWERIYEVVRDLRLGVLSIGSARLRIPPCDMCKVANEVNPGLPCEACRWFEMCNTGMWYDIASLVDQLEKKVAEYVKKAKEARPT